MLAASSYTQQPQLAFSVDRGTWVAAGDVPPEPAILPAPSARASPPRRALSTPFADLNPAQVRSVAGDVADILFHVDALRDAESIEAVVDAAGALADLCSTSRAGAAGAEAMRHAIANADAIPALVELLELQAQPRVPAQAAWTLASLMYGSPSNRESAVVAGAAPRLVALLTVGKEPTAPSGTAEEAAYALKIMCWQHPPSKDAVVDAGGVAALIRLLALSRHENTLLHACGALANLAVERAHRRRTVEEGGVPPLLQLLSSKRQLVLQEAAALAVKALAWEEEDNKRALRRAGAVKRLVRLLERKPEHAIVSASSELPEGWSQHWTPDGRPYYKEHATGSTHWQPPAAIAPTLQRAQRRLAAAQLAAVQALLNLSYEKGRGRRALISANAPPSLRRLLAAPTSSDELSGAAAVLLKRLGYREGMDGDGETLPAPVAEPRPATAAPPSAGLAGGYKPVHAPGLPPAPSAARPWTAPAPAAEPAKVAKKKQSKKSAHSVPTVPDEAYGELRDGVRRIEESIEALRAELQARTVVTTADMSTAPAPAPEPEPEPVPALASKEKPLAADAAAGSFAAFLAANESGEGSQDQEEVLEVSVGSGGLDIGSDISISADSPRPAPSQDQEEEEEEVLEISAGALSLGSEISLSEGDSGTVKDTGLAPAPASTAGSDVISFEGSDLDIGEGDMEIELSTGGADEPARSEEEPRAFSRAGPSPVAAPAPEPEPQVDEADLVRRMIDEPGTLSRAEEDSGLTYKREFISYIQRRADELPGGRGKDFLRAHRINGNVESLRKARNKKDLHAAYVAWQKLAALYERGPGGTIVLKKTPEDRRREEEEKRRAEEAKRAAELKERYGRRRGDDTELDEIDDLLGPDTPPSTVAPSSRFRDEGRSTSASATSRAPPRSTGPSAADMFRPRGGAPAAESEKEDEESYGAEDFEDEDEEDSKPTSVARSGRGAAPAGGMSSLSDMPSLAAPAPAASPGDGWMDEIEDILGSD